MLELNNIDLEYDIDELEKFKDKELENKLKLYQKKERKKSYNKSKYENYLENYKRYEKGIKLYNNIRKGKIKSNVIENDKDLKIISGLLKYKYVLRLNFRNKHLDIDLMYKIKEGKDKDNVGDICRYRTNYILEFKERDIVDIYGYLKEYNNIILNTGKDIFLKTETYYLGFDKMVGIDDFIFKEFGHKLKDIVDILNVDKVSKYQILNREDIKDKILVSIMYEYSDEEMLSGRYKNKIKDSIKFRDGIIGEILNYFNEDELNKYINYISKDNFKVIDDIYYVYNNNKRYKKINTIGKEYKNILKDSKMYYNKDKRGTQRQLLKEISKEFNSDKNSLWLDDMYDKKVNMTKQDLW